MAKRRGEFDATAFDACVKNPPTIIELLEQGTPEEIRGALLGIGLALEHGGTLGPATAAWLGKALQKIHDGIPVKDPDDDRKWVRKRISADAALGLTNKRKYGVYESHAREHMVATAKGVTRAEAEQFAARYDPVTNTLKDDPGDTAGDSYRKRRQRQGTK